MNNNLKLTTEKLRNIREDLADNTQITLTSGAVLYAGADSFRVRYTTSGGEEQELSVPAYQNVSFPKLINIVGLSGNAYVSMGILQDIQGTDVIDYIGMPLSIGTKIKYTGSTDILNESSHIDIRYYDDTFLQMDMRDIRSYTLYDL
jgi:hypothetical protein